ncbi:MAG: hypothetical protein ACYSU7_06180 [Planctomycetota bacterium]|jgi:hypothetical protein
MIRASAVFLAFVLLAGGCGESADEGSLRPPRTTKVTEQAAIDIAKETVRDRDGWSDAGAAEATPMGNGWTVSVWRETMGSGDVRLVVLDGEGKVIRYQEG